MRTSIVVCVSLLSACATDIEVDSDFEPVGATLGVSIEGADRAGAPADCLHQASSSIPADNRYYVTTFGDPSGAKGPLPNLA